MTYRLSKTIVLIGLMGAGKTAVGRLLAQALGVDFIDSDEEIIKAANASIPEIFERDGEAFFRQKETQILDRLLDGPPCVLSTGGGAYMAAQNRKLISQKAVALWLRADLDILWERVRHKDTRPLLRVADPKAKLTALLNARTPLYAKAELMVDAEAELTLEQMTAKTVKTLLDNPISGVVKD
ncbi:MAG: shikimate kinase [Amylibacter sp.]|nr:shikimate kinase [Amylibacter sp.]